MSADIEVLEVRRLALPEMTPAFLDRIGGFEDEEELRDAVRGELERQLTYHQQAQNTSTNHDRTDEERQLGVAARYVASPGTP